jgi:hypothetical protein
LDVFAAREVGLMSSDNTIEQKQQQQQEQKSATAVTNFLKTYERLPVERKELFRTKMMKFSILRISNVNFESGHEPT